MDNKFNYYLLYLLLLVLSILTSTGENIQRLPRLLKDFSKSSIKSGILSIIL